MSTLGDVRRGYAVEMVTAESLAARLHRTGDLS